MGRESREMMESGGEEEDSRGGHKEPTISGYTAALMLLATSRKQDKCIACIERERWPERGGSRVATVSPCCFEIQ